MTDAKSSDNLSSRFRKDTEEQFSNSGIFYRQAIENADGVPFQLIFGPGPGEGHYLNIGTGIRKLVGIPPEEFTEKGFNDIIEEIVPLAEDFPVELSELRKKFIDGELKTYKADVLIRMPGGEKKWIQDSSLPLIDENTGKVIGAFGILFDINDRKQFLDHMEKAKEKAEEADRLKSAFLRNISHEIRTPLNSIVGYTALLCDAENDPEKRKEFIDVIFSSTDHLLEIIDDIVEISNIEANLVEVRKEPVNIDSIFRKVYDRFRIKAGEKRNALSFDIDNNTSVVKIYTDSYKLTQILSNLLGNAMKFTENGEVRFGYILKENKIEFYVSDTGIGIPPEKYEMIFKRFYQIENSLTRRFEGTGLGLCISKAYVEMLGGEIWFNSQHGEGSVFYFSLPCNSMEG